MNDQETPNTGPSRREFVMGTGAAVTATALTALATPEALAADLQPGGNPAVPAIGPAAMETAPAAVHKLTARARRPSS